MKKRFGPFVILMAGAVFVLAIGLYSMIGSQANAAKDAEARADDFSLLDLDGRQFRLSDYRGRPVLLIFSTTWCNYCRAEIPHFKDIHSRYSRRGVEVVNVDIQESRDRVARFARRYNLPYRTLLDVDGSVAELYSILGVPTLVLIDGTGKIVCRQCRKTEALLDKILQK